MQNPRAAQDAKFRPGLSGCPNASKSYHYSVQKPNSEILSCQSKQQNTNQTKKQQQKQRRSRRNPTSRLKGETYGEASGPVHCGTQKLKAICSAREEVDVDEEAKFIFLHVWKVCNGIMRNAFGFAMRPNVNTGSIHLELKCPRRPTPVLQSSTVVSSIAVARRPFSALKTQNQADHFLIQEENAQVEP